MNSIPENNTGSTERVLDKTNTYETHYVCILPELPSSQPAVSTISREEKELQKENSPIKSLIANRLSPGKVLTSALQIADRDNQLVNDCHGETRVTPNNDGRRVSIASSPTATPLRTLTKFVYKPNIKSNGKVETDPDNEATDSGYLSDDTSSRVDDTEEEAHTDVVRNSHLKFVGVICSRTITSVYR